MVLLAGGRNVGVTTVYSLLDSLRAGVIASNRMEINNSARPFETHSHGRAEHEIAEGRYLAEKLGRLRDLIAKRDAFEGSLLLLLADPTQKDLKAFADLWVDREAARADMDDTLRALIDSKTGTPRPSVG